MGAMEMSFLCKTTHAIDVLSQRLLTLYKRRQQLSSLIAELLLTRELFAHFVRVVTNG